MHSRLPQLLTQTLIRANPSQRSEVKNISTVQKSCLLSLSTLISVFSVIPAQAQITNPTAPSNSFDPNGIKINLDSGFQVINESNSNYPQLNFVNFEQTNSNQPIPGTVATSVEALQIDTSANPTQQAQVDDFTVAQERNLRRDRDSIGAYIGVGGNIGIDGDTPIGDFAGVVFSRIPLITNLSLRPSVLISDEAAFLIPLTYDFVLPGETPYAPKPYVPYVGAGLALSTEENDNVGFLFSTGLDWHLSEKWLGNVQLNVGAIDEDNGIDLGLRFGVGYKLSGN